MLINTPLHEDAIELAFSEAKVFDVGVGLRVESRRCSRFFLPGVPEKVIFLPRLVVNMMLDPSVPTWSFRCFTLMISSSSGST